MMRLIFLSVLLPVSFCSRAQNGLTVTYSRTFYTPSLSPRAILSINRDRVHCDKNLSFYYTMGTGSDPHKKDKVVDIQGSFYFDFEKQIIYNVHVMPKEIGTLLIIDSLIAGNWTFLKSTKRIKGYNCKLAVTENKNHDSTFVWYTEDIPFRSGPSRFVGFPGLVLEVFDNFNRWHYKVNSIKEKKDPVLLPRYKILTRKEYIETF